MSDARDVALSRSVAVIGMAARLPGARTVEDYWRNLCEGVESIRRFTPDELRAAGVPERRYCDDRYVPARGALGDVDVFDAEYFGISPREAELTDPQQRLFLECVEEALQDAGYDATRVTDRVAVFAGCSASTYVRGLQRLADELDLDEALIRLGNDVDFLATRVAYRLDLTGPCVTVQTACSTGLVAIHLACRSLLAGECEMAVAGAVSIVHPEESGYLYERGSICSPDGRCRAFDADAAGTVSGNGGGAVVLKPLVSAIRDRDAVRCVVLGSAINNDGASKVGFTAPSVQGQRAVVRAALDASGVEPATVRYVEAHGTGTPLGDPVEVQALRQAFGEAPAAGSRLLGSVKPNVGHLDVAAGIAGFVKAALVVERGLVPATLHFRNPNPEAPLAAGGFSIAASPTPWPDASRPRRAGVSSFGVGGTNAHVIVEEPEAPAAEPGEPSWQVLPLAARTPTSLERQAERLARHLRGGPPDRLDDIAFTLQVGRRELQERLAVVARSAEDAAAGLASRDPALVARGSAVPGSPPRVAFVFLDRAPVPSGLVRSLAATAPRLAIDLDECRAAVGRHGDPDAPAPTLFALQYALARLWTSWGVEPSCLLADGLGELAAAAVAGVLTLGDAARLAALHIRQGGRAPADEDRAYRDALAGCALGEPAIPVVSGATRVDAATIVDPRRRRAAADRPERFATACRWALAGAADLLLEVGPAAGLDALVRASLGAGEAPPPCVSSLGMASTAGAPLGAAAQLWTRGVPLDWKALHGTRSPRRVHLPTYAFERTRHSLGAPAMPPPQEPPPQPATGIQASLVGIFESVLGVEAVGLHDSFFELGGDSLMTIRVLSRIRDLYGVDVPDASLFEAPTIAELEVVLYAALEAAVERMDEGDVEALLTRLDGEPELG